MVQATPRRAPTLRPASTRRAPPRHKPRPPDQLDHRRLGGTAAPAVHLLTARAQPHSHCVAHFSRGSDGDVLSTPFVSHAPGSILAASTGAYAAFANPAPLPTAFAAVFTSSTTAVGLTAHGRTAPPRLHDAAHRHLCPLVHSPLLVVITARVNHSPGRSSSTISAHTTSDGLTIQATHCRAFPPS